MIFKTKNLEVDLIEDKDIKEVLEVYNSNDHFLSNHLDTHEVTREWILKELKDMKKIGFHSCKIVERNTDKIIGIADFKMDEESYLSLLMIHRDFHGKGYGKLFLQGFEKYARNFKCKWIRIDVVTNYDNSVLRFWLDNGFSKFKDIDLNWSGKFLTAVYMKKFL